MSKKEIVKPNKVPATLFVGVGGIGSKIVSKVSDLGRNDSFEQARFVIMDTDVNDLNRSDDDINITTIQTSSPRSIRDYLIQDADARNEWFPNNSIINGKTVSEGAGQIRAISRLALNATIKQGKINILYKAIDDLYLKDGATRKQTIKVIIASTVAGGTGSGIAMIVAMLIRNYINKKYPESSAIIRGFFIMPGVMECLDLSYTERKSMQRNGYAAIKEINAFMMKPFFESVPELRRYKNINVTVPTTSGSEEKISCLPFDFCFLFDRTDADEHNMQKLHQYIDYVAHSIYEQCIGPMNKSASSKEDNVLKEFIDDKKLGRSRFGGAGASVIRYPYSEIIDYIALDWIEKRIMGIANEDVSDEDKNKMLDRSWLTYDNKYWVKKKEYDHGVNIGVNEPIRSKIYIQNVEASTDDFSEMLNEKYIMPKNNKFKTMMASKNLPAVENYISEIINRASELYKINGNYTNSYINYMQCKDAKPSEISFTDRYQAIDIVKAMIKPSAIKNAIETFMEQIFEGTHSINAKNDAYMLESFLSIDGLPMHPNAMRYMLYKLLATIEEEIGICPDISMFEEEINTLCLGPKKAGTSKGKNGENDTTERDKSRFKVAGNGAEDSLSDMCDSCDNSSIASENSKRLCTKYTTAYANSIYTWYMKFLRYYVCSESKIYVERIIAAFEDFYDSFSKKSIGIGKRKKTILDKIKFENGDCVLNLFNNPKHLKKLVELQTLPASGGKLDSTLHGGIYDAVKSNSKTADRLAYDVFYDGGLIDIFDTVIIETYKDIVADKCDETLDVDILRGMSLEHMVKCLCEAESQVNEIEKEYLVTRSKSYKEINAYISKMLDRGMSLASPSITRKDFDESREVNAIAFNKFIEEGEGISIPRALDAKNASDTVSKYELRFFRSIYDIMPTQLQKMCSPEASADSLEDCVDYDVDANNVFVGEYFTSYQEYMTKIGPDNRLNPVITPHIDKRWNSISVFPEIDPRGYQRCLMKEIHQAMIYGFIFKIIDKHIVSSYDKSKAVFRYKDGRNGYKKFIVSNHTKCDRLFEVLDSLYFDRYAVQSILSSVGAIRDKEYTNSTAYENTSFVKLLGMLNRRDIVNNKQQIECSSALNDAETSLFEIPMLYWHSLPKKDAAEIEVMIEAIFDVLDKEVRTFADEGDVNPIIAATVAKHYKLLVDNFKTCPEVYVGDGKVVYLNEQTKEVDLTANDVIQTIRKKVEELLLDLDVSDDEQFMLD